MAGPRVVLFANTSWYLWNFRRSLAEKLKTHGCKVIFAAPVDEYTGHLQAIGRFVPIRLDRKGRNPAKELLALLRMARVIRETRPDLVLTWTPKPNIYCALAGRVMGIPVIPNVAGLGFAFIGGAWLARIAAMLYRVAFGGCQVVFFQNDHDLDQFLSAGWVKKEAARLLPGSGVDLERFRSEPARDAGDFVFLFVGRLLADKGLRELVQAARRIRQDGGDVRLRVAGLLDVGNPATVSEQELREWDREGVIEYLGQSDEPEKLMADADCVVLPSFYREGVPRALLEAAACARPVITTDTPGCRDAVVDGQTGFLCRPRDVESLAIAMRKMLVLSAQEREAMGRAGRGYMERSFSEDVVLGAYEQALAAVLGGTGQPDATRES